jgi:hypothetical protein
MFWVKHVVMGSWKSKRNKRVLFEQQGQRKASSFLWR